MKSIILITLTLLSACILETRPIQNDPIDINDLTGIWYVSPSKRRFTFRRFHLKQIQAALFMNQITINLILIRLMQIF